MIDARDNKAAGTVSVSLYDVATSPTHFDFNINSKEKYLGRLIFDIKMDQKIILTLKSKQLVCKSEKPLAAKGYVYKMTLMHNKKRIQSELSGDFNNLFLNQVDLVTKKKDTAQQFLLDQT